MARTAILICYDISDTRRWREVFETCKAFGDHMQYSVFTARLTDMAYAELVTMLSDAINAREDRVLIVRLGPDGKDLAKRVKTLGRQEKPFGREDDMIF